jgi:hypothetical protein
MKETILYEVAHMVKVTQSNELPTPQKQIEFTVYFVNPEHDGRVLLEDIAAALKSMFVNGVHYRLTRQRRRHYWKLQFDCDALNITEQDIRGKLSSIDATWIEGDGIERRIREVPLVPYTLHAIVGSPSPEALAEWQKEAKRLTRLETKKRNRLNTKRRDNALYRPPV